MPRLFTAIALPPAVTQALADLQPSPAPGVRPVVPAQMHVTLHFIGEAEIECVAALLQKVAVPPCAVLVSGVGQFGRGSVLWAGVDAQPALLQLHAVIGQALAAGGIAVEARPYRPHITLARCKPHASANLVPNFLDSHAALRLPSVTATRFALYSSTPSVSGPRYRVERWFPSS